MRSEERFFVLEEPLREAMEGRVTVGGRSEEAVSLGVGVDLSEFCAAISEW